MAAKAVPIKRVIIEMENGASIEVDVGYIRSIMMTTPSFWLGSEMGEWMDLEFTLAVKITDIRDAGWKIVKPKQLTDAEFRKEYEGDWSQIGKDDG